MDVQKRADFIISSRRCHNCLSIKHTLSECQSQRNCLKCSQRHHTLLHDSHIDHNPPVKPHTSSPTQTMGDDDRKHQSVSSTNVTLSLNSNSRTFPALLPTAIIGVQDGNGHEQLCRALLDSGSRNNRIHQASFISEKCVQRLQLKRRNSRVTITGLGQSQAGVSRGKTTIKVKPIYGSNLLIDVLILPKVAVSSGATPGYSDLINHSLGNIKLADPSPDRCGVIDILIGADHFFNILLNEKIQINNSNLVAQKTIFGWIIAGTSGSMETETTITLTTTLQEDCHLNIDKTLRQFWELESIHSQPTLSAEENFCENHFLENVARNDEGRLIVRLPFKEKPELLGNSYNRARQRLEWMEKKFNKDQELKQLYHNFMLEYEQLDHMREIESVNASTNGYFLPHHGVLKKSKDQNKIRVVFDGSALPSNGKPLNKCLAVGPTVQPNLASILLRFRERRVVFTSDMEKMYRQIHVADCDIKYQKLLWRTDPSKPIKQYELRRVTYGLSSSAFLATRSIKFIGDSVREESPKLARLINQDIYVDDVMTGADTEEEALKLKSELIKLLKNFGIPLKKWKSNNLCVLNDIPVEDRDSTTEQFIHETSTFEQTKVLGILWNPVIDEFKFSTPLAHQTKCTKRSILSDISRLFDPLGWVAPVIIAYKSFMQLLWAANLDWDDTLPDILADKWKTLREGLLSIEKIHIPRYINTTNSSVVDIHGFADASTVAYAAVVYFRVSNTDGTVEVFLVGAKTKVSPIKQVSIPRLELCAAVLLVQLIDYIKAETSCLVQQTYGWSDSTIVLDWIAGHPKRWSTFVGNRTTEIKVRLPRRNWMHVPTNDNPADCASRGSTATLLQNNQLWWKGPDWLKKPPSYWPQQQPSYDTVEEQSNELFSFTGATSNTWMAKLMEKYNSFHKLLLIFGYISRFINNSSVPNDARTHAKFLTNQEIFEATRRICKYEQTSFYQQELRSIELRKHVHRTSHILSLNPFIDKHGLLRVGGRINNSDAPYNVRHPIIIHENSRCAALILMDEHTFNKHAGPTLMTSLSRQRFWIPRCKSTARKVIKDCIPCTRHKAVLRQQIMGDLPTPRVRYSRPFESMGVDFAGPIQIHLTRGRGSRPRKSYICVFICLSVKAIHLELVNDLTSDSFLAAMKRFIAPRGICKHIHSDNGTNFTGAAAKIKEEFENSVKKSGSMHSFLSRNEITWHFNPPNSPHFGGLWESAVRSVKFHLRRVIGKTILTMEEMTTLLAEVESILNSRPLCRSDAEEPDPLTPSHFLIGYATGTLPEKDVVSYKPSYLSRWQQVQRLSQQFWRRWYTEYLTSLQQRTKWLMPHRSVEVGDIVLVKEPNMKPRDWLMGQITVTYPGRDGKTRVVSLRTSRGELKRPVHNLCLLPIDVESNKTTIDRHQPK